MATGIFCTNAEVERRAGANASATSSAVGYTDDYITQAESFINCVTRFNYSDDYAGLDVDVKGILKMAASCLAAMDVIMYDMSGFTSRYEAETMLDMLRDKTLMAIALLSDEKVNTFIQDA